MPKNNRINLVIVLLASLFLAGCAANQLPGFENTYYSYNIPQPLLDRIMLKFREHGLVNARITRDLVGRVRLIGSYLNEEEVDRAFIIAQSIVGLKSTSPFYPENIKEKRWETQAAKALNEVSKTSRVAPPQKRALVIGINKFRDSKNLSPIQGEDDAVVVRDRAEAEGYAVTALLGQEATKAKIEAALGSLEAKVGSDDSLFVYISSHGIMPVPSHEGKDERKMSIAAYDSGDYITKSKDETDYLLKVQDTSVPDTLVQKLVNKPTRITHVIIDTCYSGEMLKGVPDDSRAYIEKTNNGQPERAGITLASWGGQQEFSSKDIKFNAESAPVSPNQASGPSRQKEVNRKLSDRKGYTLITATSDGEKSWGPDASVGTFQNPLPGGKELKGSFFTQAFFAYLKIHDGKIVPAFEEARRFTEQQVRKGTGGQEHQVPRQYSTSTAEKNVFSKN